MSQSKSRQQSKSKTQKLLQKRGILKIVTPASQRQHGGATITQLHILDGYHGKMYKLERLATRLVGSSMESYLAKRPDMPFSHPKNKARKILYTLPAIKEWATLAPGALALEPIHHPKQKRLATGRRLDPLTSRIFRHSYDTVGVRTRTLAAGWIAHAYAAERTGQPLSWVSLAGGTAAPTMLMVDAAGINRRTLHYTNIDQDSWAIEVAREVTTKAGLQAEYTVLIVGDIFDENNVHATVGLGTADIIDMMGIFEYMDEQQSVRLLSLAYGLLKPGGIVIACNMRLDHPQLNLHKRGVGWPSVIQKSTDDLIAICQKAGITQSQLDIYQPMDGVYNVIRITKS